MKYAIVGGTGFVGSHLARALVAQGHQVVVTARGRNSGKGLLEEAEGVTLVEAPVSDTPALVAAFRDCDAVFHCAGINRESGEQTFDKVHIQGTGSVLSAMRQSQAGRLLFVSFLRARNFVDSPYHTTKWHAEEMIRKSGLPYTILKPGVIFGEGDGFVSNLKRTLKTFPFFGLVGTNPPPLAPVHIDDLCRVMSECAIREEALEKTFPVLGPREYTLKELVRVVADSEDIVPMVIPLPIFFHRLAALIMEKTMNDPFLSSAQVTMLSESLSEPSPPCDELPDDLRPTREFIL